MKNQNNQNKSEVYLKDILDNISILTENEIAKLKTTDEGNLILNFLDSCKTKDELGPHEVLGLSLATEFIQLPTFKISTFATKQQIKDLENYKIDSKSILESTILNEFSQSLLKNAFNKIKNQSQDFSSMLKSNLLKKLFKKIKKFVFKLLKINYIEKIKVNSDRIFISKLLTMSNKIAMETRIGAGYFIICSPGVATIFEDMSFFNYNNTVPVMKNTTFQVIGNIANLKVIVDYNMKFNDTTVYVGQSTKENQKGCYLIINKNSFDISTEENKDNMGNKITLSGRYETHITKNSNSKYLKATFKFGKNLNQNKLFKKC